MPAIFLAGGFRNRFGLGSTTVAVAVFFFGLGAAVLLFITLGGEGSRRSASACDSAVASAQVADALISSSLTTSVGASVIAIAHRV